VPAGGTAEVVAVAAGRQAAGFLAASGVGPGRIITVVATGGEGVLIRTVRGEAHLDVDTAATILVRPEGVGDVG